MLTQLSTKVIFNHFNVREEHKNKSFCFSGLPYKDKLQNEKKIRLNFTIFGTINRKASSLTTGHNTGLVLILVFVQIKYDALCQFVPRNKIIFHKVNHLFLFENEKVISKPQKFCPELCGMLKWKVRVMLKTMLTRLTQVDHKDPSWLRGPKLITTTQIHEANFRAFSKVLESCSCKMSSSLHTY